MAGEVVEARGPHPPVRGEPLVDRLQGLRSHAVETSLGVAADLDEPRLAENPQVLGDGWLAQLELRDKLAYRLLCLSEEIEDPPAVRLGHDIEHRHSEKSMLRELYICQGK